MFDNINPVIGVDIVKLGPYREKDFKYPISIVDKTERQFSDCYHLRELPNGEDINRHWLVYSTLNDHVYYFSYKLFPNDKKKLRNSFLSMVGSNDWKHLSKRLKTHETSRTHLNSLHN